MSEILDAVGSILQTAGVGTAGTDLFLSRRPETPDVCVTVYESGTGYPIYTHGANGAALYSTNIQVTARAEREDYPAARTKITAVITAMEAVRDSTISGITILRIEQFGRPIPMGYDGNDRPTVAMNFSVTHV